MSGNDKQMTFEAVCAEENRSDGDLRDLINGSGDCVYEMDNHGNLTGYSSSFPKVLGYPEEEILHKKLGDLMDTRQSRKFYAAFNKVWITHRGFSNLIWETRDKAGNRKAIELSAYLVKNHEGKKLGFRGIARDVTERFKTIHDLKEAQRRYEREFEAKRKARRRTQNLLDFVPYPMVVFSSSGNVTYVNPAFTHVFGWHLEELIGRKIPYYPPGYEMEVGESVKRLEEDADAAIETRRTTKDGRILDVIIRGQLSSKNTDDNPGELFILQDVTEERRIERINETLFQISSALPGYPVLQELLDYITGEVKRLLNTEGAVVGLFDEDLQYISFLGAAYDDISTQRRIKKVRPPIKKGVIGRVLRTGEPAVVTDTAKDPDFLRELDNAIGFRTDSLLVVPLEGGKKIIGILTVVNKKAGSFDEKDRKLLTMIAGTVALSLENARFSRELTDAYEEVASLNRAKDKIINHLSHELKTPASILLGSLVILSKKLKALPEKEWAATFQRAERNLDRILEIQYQVEDIMRGREYKSYAVLSIMVDQCMDELESLLAEKVGEGEIVTWLRNRLESEFGPRESKVEEIYLNHFVAERLAAVEKDFSHRNVDIITHLEGNVRIYMPRDVMEKVIDGLVKNAVENTPDEGRVDLFVKNREDGALLVVKDFGVGILPEDRKRIFEGFFSTQETMDYSSKQPFDFNAGGKGADLLRMKVFGERYGFQLNMTSTRCCFLEHPGAVCPGSIDRCEYCQSRDDCINSGGTSFTALFPMNRRVT
ncbi:MAG: PAS domain S-box protein [Deltaproteobacteria bacterium]|nr:PAS domain S-box protein [Deltaproteobacteria bacterium]